MSQLLKDVKNEDGALEEGKVNSPVPLFDETSTTSWPAVEVLIDTDESQNGEKSADKEQSSEIWSVFTRIDDALAKCNLCQIELSCKDSISDLTAHREVEHLGVLLQCNSSDDEVAKNGLHSISAEEKCSSTPQSSKDSSSNDESQNGEKSADKEQSSDIWSVFTRIDDSLAKCNLCQIELSCKDSISDLTAHREVEHLGVLLQCDSSEDEAEKCFEDDSASQPLDKSTVSDVEGIDSFQEGSEGENSEKFKKSRKRTSDAQDSNKSTDLRPSKRKKTENPSVEEVSTEDNLQSSKKQNSDFEDYRASGVDKRCNKRSLVWKLYRKLKNGYWQCKICGAVMSQNSIVSNLRRHIRRAHPSHMSAAQNAGASSYARKMFSTLENGRSECNVCGELMSENATVDSLMRHVRAHSSSKYKRQKRDAASEVETGNRPSGKRKRPAPVVHTFETAEHSDGGTAGGCERPPDPSEERGGTFRNVRRGCPFSERSVLAVEERNHLLRDLQGAMERQGQVLDRIVACLEGMSRRQKNGTSAGDALC